MQAIATELASGKYDFAFLQEVWTTEDYERIKVKTEQVLPYSHYFYRSAQLVASTVIPFVVISYHLHRIRYLEF